MIFDYNKEVENILNKIYEKKIHDIVIKTNTKSIDKKNIYSLSNTIISTNVYLGSDFDEFIISLIPSGKDGYFFRCEIARNKNYSFPKLYDYLGNPLKNPSYNKFAYQLWESNMNDMLISDIQYKFNQKDFNKFVKNNLKYIIDDLVYTINKNKKLENIILPIKSKNDLIPVIKSMLINKELDFSWIELIVDIDMIRDYMSKFSVALNMYDEFDMIDDKLEFCIDNFCKYNSNELFDLLVNEKNFVFKKGIGLIKNNNN
ncbi:hypothetical protein CHF27_000450 [Romboutsia maritimum]|uniref:Uncharacterized protein n=1 Tax=Romboutsia maritimum TaxID=2020948 RepID=A0A371IW45_9FIRM|nr:hypothetical protein [Romboutsia maritimum]RDY24704.1 hypothetical protein CHF27_000450 [Romboutsia maritimum]